MPRLEKFVISGGEPVRSLRDRVRDGVRSFWTGPITSNSPELAKFFSSVPVSSGVTVNDSTAFMVSAFWCAATMISQDVASLPLFLFKSLPGGGKARFEGHPLNRLLHDQANPEITAFQFRASLLLNALALGNGYAEIARDSAGRPVALWYLTPNRVTPFRANARAPLQYRISNNGGDESTIIDASDMLHLHGPGPDGMTGYDVIQLARESLGLSLAAERYGSYAFGNGLSFGGVITYEGNPADEVKKNNREVLERRHAGVENARKFLALYGGAKFQATATSPHDAQFQELRTFQIREVARWFKMPPHKLADLADATFSNVEQQNIDYYTSCLRPWIINLEQELNAKLIAPSEKNLQHCEHVVEGFLRADSQQRAAFYASMLSTGSMTINEVRERENLPPIEGGDTPRVPLNTTPLSAASLRAVHEDFQPEEA